MHAGPDVPFLEARGLRFVELEGSTRSMSLAVDLRAARSLWRILRARAARRAAHAQPQARHLRPGPRDALAGVPLVVHTTHGLYAAPDDQLAKRLVVYGLEAVASRFSHVELVQNPEDLELMRRLRIAPRRKLRLLGNGVDLQRFRPPTDARARRCRVRARHRRRRTSWSASSPGSWPRRAAGARRRRSARLGAARSGSSSSAPTIPPRPTPSTRACSTGRRGAGAVLTGHRDDVERLYAAMDVFCLPSHREGFPRAAMEAAASGLPVVATDIRGCRQVVEHGVTGRPRARA